MYIYKFCAIFTEFRHNGPIPILVVEKEITKKYLNKKTENGMLCLPLRDFCGVKATPLDSL